MPNVETILLVVIGLVVLFVVVAMLRAVRIVPQSYAIIVERLLHRSVDDAPSRMCIFIFWRAEIWLGHQANLVERRARNCPFLLTKFKD